MCNCTRNEWGRWKTSLEMSGEDVKLQSRCETLHKIIFLHSFGVCFSCHCSFVRKAQVAQDFKRARAVVVIQSAEKGDQDVHNVIPADDGYGEQVRLHSKRVEKM